MRRLVHALVLLFACAYETRAESAPPARYIYWVDVRRALVGSVAEAVMRHATCPVLVIRAKE